MADPLGRGRPCLYTPELAAEICERLSEGETLASICRGEHMPTTRTVNDWTRQDECRPEDVPATFGSEFAQARARGFDAIADDTMAIVDTVPERHATEHGDRVDAGHVAWLKNRAEQRLKLLAKWDPKRYGERVQTEHSGSVGVTVAATKTDEDL